MIPNLEQTVFDGFIGKNTDDNTTKTGPQFLLAAKNLICQGDSTVKTCPGYTLVKQLDGKVVKLWEWIRQTDKKQFLFVQHGAKLGVISPDGTGAETTFSTIEDVTQLFDFVNNAFSVYCNNGINAYKITDNGGTLTKYQWGINAPTVAPTVSFSAGALTLTYGRQYLMCFVSYITDSQGIQRMHIGPPSPLTAHTGPHTSQTPTLGSLQVSSDPQVTHKWIFATVDTPLNTTSAFYFAAELTNATTSWGDTLADSALDTSRLAPFDNNPAPLGYITVSYQNRAVVIDPKTGNVMFSGFEEIDLGIPMEAFPSDLFFPLPGGFAPTGAAVVDQGDTLMIGSEEAWAKLTGYNADTFQMKERIVGPGPVSKEGIAITPTHLTWVSRPKQIWAWDTRIQNYTGIPAVAVEISNQIQQQLKGTYSMADLKDSELSNVRLNWFMYGKHHFLVCSGNTTDELNAAQKATTDLNWIQLWYVDYENGTISSVAETDFIPSDSFASCANALVGSTPYLFFGDFSNGMIYRWPDGFLHNGKKFHPLMSLAWSLCEFDGKKRFFWADVITDRSKASDSFKILAAAGGAPNMEIVPVLLPLRNIPAPEGEEGQAIRANMQQKGSSFGTFARIVVEFPADGQQSTLKKITVYSQPMTQGAP